MTKYQKGPLLGKLYELTVARHLAGTADEGAELRLDIDIRTKIGNSQVDVLIDRVAHELKHGAPTDGRVTTLANQILRYKALSEQTQ